MEAVGQLTGGLAHDFNNLLSTITTCLELIRRRTATLDLPDLQRYLATADRSVKGAAALTHRLLAFSRKQSLDLQVVDVNALGVGLEDLLRRTLGEQLRLALRLQPDAWPVRTDVHQLENALLNLAINARDAMPQGGQLTIETENLSVSPHMPGAPELAEGDYLVISVSDTGTGMPQEVIDRAFDPFFTTKGIGKGTGLGLSMIYGYARQSGGQVTIFSRVGEGTTVKLFLPRAPADAQEAAIEPVGASGRTGGDGGGDGDGRGRGERLLVVDDNADLRGLLVDSLRSRGYVVTAAGTGQDALALIEHEPFDLLITDVGLPDLTGRQLADLARAVRPALPVLMITGYAKEAAVRGEFVGSGMAMLSKPFAVDALVRQAQGLLRAHAPVLR